MAKVQVLKIEIGSVEVSLLDKTFCSLCANGYSYLVG